MSTGKGYPESQYAVKLEANRWHGWGADRFSGDGGRIASGWFVRLFIWGKARGVPIPIANVSLLCA
jgi:hypothetical protein